MFKLRDNLFIFLIGIAYYFSFHGITVGDQFYKSFEAGYPLFLSSNYLGRYHWFGFLFPHFLNYPTLRFTQIILARAGLLPLPILLFQITNLVLSLLTLKLVYSILLRLDIRKTMAMASTVLFAFSFGFYANMNAEFHHFSIFFIAAYVWFLINIEKNKTPGKGSIFIFCSCLVLAPLYHIESIIYSACVLVYIIFKKDLRDKLISNLYPVFYGLILLPVFLITCAFTLHYLDLGRSGILKYIYEIPDILWFKRFGSMATTSYSILAFKNVYIMLRAFLESFSIISRDAKIVQHYKDIVFYSGSAWVNLAITIIFAYCLIFFSLGLRCAGYFIKNWKNIFPGIRLLLVMLLVYLFAFGMFMNLLLSEFYISAALICCILFGYVFNEQSKRWKIAYFLLVLLTVVSNIWLFIYPQKASAVSINKIIADIESRNKGTEKIDIFRISFMVFPEEAERRKEINIYYDEHAYESEKNVLEYLALMDKEFAAGKKVFLIAPGFLFDSGDAVNINSAIPMSMDEDPNLIKNLRYLVEYINHNYKLAVTKNYPYNFGTLGQLGKVAVVELK